MRADEPMKWPVTDREVLGTGRVSSFVEETISTPSGEEIVRQYVTHPGAVAIVAWREDTDDIAVLRQYRHPVGMELVEIPAGLLDVDGEDYLIAGSCSSTSSPRPARARSRCGCTSRATCAPHRAPMVSCWRARRHT